MTEYQKESLIRFSLDENKLIEISNFCHQNEVDFSSTTYSTAELNFLVKFCRPAFIKVASMDINNFDFLMDLGKYGLPVILSTGMSSFEEVISAVELVLKDSKVDLTILHCTSNYPTDFEEANLNNIVTLKNLFPNIDIGYSDHTIGFVAPVIATTLGAKVIEKHFTLDNSIIGMDNQMATEPNEFLIMINQLKNTYKIIGSYERIINEKELKMRSKMRRSLVLSCDAKKGTTITLDMLEAKRPGVYISVSEKQEFIGKKLKVDLTKGDYLKYDLIDMED